MVEVGTSSRQYLNQGHACLTLALCWITSIHVLCIIYTHIHSQHLCPDSMKFFLKRRQCIAMTSSYNLDNRGDGRPPCLDWVDFLNLDNLLARRFIDKHDPNAS